MSYFGLNPYSYYTSIISLNKKGSEKSEPLMNFTSKKTVPMNIG
jgi:hypothetical protein